MRHLSHRASVFLFAAVELAACDSSRRVAPDAVGSLTITVVAANGITPSVAVTGPKSYHTTITSSETLNNLALGSYVVVADSVAGPDSIIGTIIDTAHVSVASVTVTANDTASATVTYSMKWRTGGMWVANNNGSALVELAAAQLRTSDSVVPAETLATPVQEISGLALDASGNLWVASFGQSSDSLVMYTPAARNADASTASRTVVSSIIGDAENLTFDAHGDLWVADCNKQILEFTPAQLVAGGAETPAVAIQGGSVLACPMSIAFDNTGNAWVADLANNHIVEYSAGQLTTSGTPTPIDTIGASGNSLSETDGLAFDAKGNLWVANNGTNTVVEYTPAQLAAGGAPAPAVTITLPSSADPFGLAFDNRGTLWVSDFNLGIMYAFTTAQLAATGAPTPAVADTVVAGGQAFGPEQPVFDPYATAAGVSMARARSRASNESQAGQLGSNGAPVLPKLRRTLRKI